MGSYFKEKSKLSVDFHVSLLQILRTFRSTRGERSAVDTIPTLNHGNQEDLLAFPT